VDITDQEFLDKYLDESTDALNRFIADNLCREALLAFSDVITKVLAAGNKIMLAGNGGSAADAQHIAGEFISRLFFDHAPLPAIALTTDSSVLTAVGNDYGYEKVFERQVLGLGVSGDVFIAISTSGKSPNILRALQAAKKRGVVALGLTGAASGPMDSLCDHVLHAPSVKTSVIQQIHIVAAHIICGVVERRIFAQEVLELP